MWRPVGSIYPPLLKLGTPFKPGFGLGGIPRHSSRPFGVIRSEAEDLWLAFMGKRTSQASRPRQQIPSDPSVECCVSHSSQDTA